MIRALMTTAVLLGMGNLHLPASSGGPVISTESDPSIDFLQTEYHPWENDSPGIARPRFNLYLVQRGSTQPPSESHSGRTSGSPPDGRAGSTRDSSRNSDLAQWDSPGNTIKEALKATRHSQRTHKRKHISTRGGGSSPTGFERRGGTH